MSTLPERSRRSRRVYLWIKESAPKAAQKWLDELLGKIDGLATNPLGHPLAPESSRFEREIRRLLFRKRRSQLRVYYTINQQRVVILTVRRSFRKPLEEGGVTL